MNKAERVSNHPVNGTGRIIVLKKGQFVKSVSITCQRDSANPLLIGWNENASVNDYLLPGDSKPYVPDYGNYLDGNEIRLKFGQIDGTALQSGINRALVTIKFEQQDDIICK